MAASAAAAAAAASAMSGAAAAAHDDDCGKSESSRKRAELDVGEALTISIPMDLFWQQLFAPERDRFKRIAYMATEDMRIAILCHALKNARAGYEFMERPVIGQLVLWTPTTRVALPAHTELHVTEDVYVRTDLLTFAISENDVDAMTTLAQEMVASGYATSEPWGNGFHIDYENILYIRLREDGYMNGSDRVWPEHLAPSHNKDNTDRRMSRLQEAILADAPGALERLIPTDSNVDDNIVYCGGQSELVYQGDTLAHFAARYRRSRVFTWLQERGASMDAENSLGETPHDIAAHTGLLGRATKAARVDSVNSADA